jgi:hypothetical protein
MLGLVRCIQTFLAVQPTIRGLSHGGSNRNGEYGAFYGMCVIVPGTLAGTWEAISGL